MANTSAGVIVARIVVVLVILGIIGACIYFFLIKNDNVRGQVYEELTITLNSEQQKTFDQNIGSSLESGTYYNVAKNLTAEQFSLYKSLYLGYYMDKLILDTYDDVLVYVGNADNGKLQDIGRNVESYEQALSTAVASQERFNATYEANDGALTTAVSADFMIFVNDFKSMQAIFHSISNATFEYSTTHYYKNMNPMLSQKYAQTYIVNQQSNLLSSKISSSVSDALYGDSRAMIVAYKDFKENDFTDQSNDADVSAFVILVSNMQNDFSAFYSAESKSAYYATASDALKQQLNVLARGVGLEGRLV